MGKDVNQNGQSEAPLMKSVYLRNTSQTHLGVYPVVKISAEEMYAIINDRPIVVMDVGERTVVRDPIDVEHSAELLDDYEQTQEQQIPIAQNIPEQKPLITYRSSFAKPPV